MADTDAYVQTCGLDRWAQRLKANTCFDTCLMISRRSASASSCILAVTSFLPARRGLAGDLGGDMALPLESGGDLCTKKEDVYIAVDHRLQHGSIGHMAVSTTFFLGSTARTHNGAVLQQRSPDAARSEAQSSRSVIAHR